MSKVQVVEWRLDNTETAIASFENAPVPSKGDTVIVNGDKRYVVLRVEWSLDAGSITSPDRVFASVVLRPLYQTTKPMPVYGDAPTKTGH